MVKDRLGRDVKLTEEQVTKAAETLLNKWLREDKDAVTQDDKEKDYENCK